LKPLLKLAYYSLHPFDFSAQVKKSICLKKETHAEQSQLVTISGSKYATSSKRALRGKTQVTSLVGWGSFMPKSKTSSERNCSLVNYATICVFLIWNCQWPKWFSTSARFLHQRKMDRRLSLLRS